MEAVLQAHMKSSEGTLCTFSNQTQLTYRISPDVSWEPAVHGVVLEHVCHVLAVNERIVDCHYFNVIALHCCASDETTDPAKTCRKIP